MKRALVVGAGGAVGEAIALALHAKGWRVDARMRTPNAHADARLRAAGIETGLLDLSDADATARALEGASAAVFTPILSTSIAALPAASRLEHVVFVSSNNVSVDPDAPVYRALAEAEARVRQRAPRAAILRPTLIYGDPRLPAVPAAMKLMRRLPVFPMPGAGRALQQPIHCADLAAVAAAALVDAPGALYAVGGPDIVPMRDFYAAMMTAMDLRKPITATPRAVLHVGRALLGARFPLDARQIARADRDRIAPPHLAPPPAWAPRIGVAEGMASLARALGFAADHVRSNT